MNFVSVKDQAKSCLDCGLKQTMNFVNMHVVSSPKSSNHVEVKFVSDGH